MTVVAIGVSHRSAPTALLEQLTFSADAAGELLSSVAASEMVSEAAVLATCNRIEIYVHAERFHEGFRDVRLALSEASGVAAESLDPHLYVYYHDDAARHLFQVAAGLDSVVLGEHEILGQTGRALEQARSQQRSGPVLNLLFQRAVESGKRVRTETDIGRSTASLSHAAVAMIEQHRPRLAESSVLLIGAGDLGASVATALRRKHPVDLMVTNRTADRAEGLAAQLDVRSVAFGRLVDSLTEVDIVVSATGAPDTIVPTDAIASVVAARGQLLVLDLALPRDVAPEAGLLDGVDLIDLTDVQSFANRGLADRRRHLGGATDIVDAELERYRVATSARQVAPLIGGFHAWADGIRTTELERYATRLAAMDPDDREAVEALSRTLVAKLLHHPTVTVKGAAGTAKGDRLAEAVRELFDLS